MKTFSRPPTARRVDGGARPRAGFGCLRLGLACLLPLPLLPAGAVGEDAAVSPSTAAPRNAADPLSWVLPTGPTAVNPLSTGTPAFAHFPPAYFGDAHNFGGVAQTDDGRLFVIAEHRLLVGSGERWRPFPGLPDEDVLQLHLTADSRLYLSFEHDFGYLDLTEGEEARDGRPPPVPQWRSISDNLPSEWVHEARWKPLFEDDRGYVYFVGGQHVFAHHPQQVLRLWKDVGLVEHIFSLQGAIHGMTADREVYRLEENGQAEISARDLPPTFEDIRASVPFSADRHLFACGAAGLATYNGHHFESFPLSGVEGTHFVPDQLLRIGPDLFVALDYAHGLLVFRRDGTVLRQVHQFGDLKARIAQAVTIDRDGWIWLAHASGLYRINAASPETTFDFHQGLEGRVLCLLEHEQHLYVGTEDGLFVWSQPRPDIAGRFDPVEGVPAASSLASTPHGLAVGTERGLWVIDGRGPYLVQTGDHRLVLQRPGVPDRLYAPTSEGVRSFHFRGHRWFPDPHALRLPTTGLATTIDAEGNLWGEYGPGRLAYFDFAEGRLEPLVYSPAEGLPLTRIRPFVAGDEVIFEGGNELYSFFPARSLFSRTEAWQPLQHALGGNPAALALSSPDQELWVATSAYGHHFARFPPAGFDYAWPAIQRFGHDPITAVYVDTIGYLWVGNGRGLMRFRPSPLVPPRAFARRTLVHRVESADRPQPILDLANGVSHLELGTFPSLQSQLRFEFSLLDYEHPGGTRFSTFLEGFDREWQPFLPEASRRVTDLPPGDYKLHIKARNRFGEEGLPASIAFTLPRSPFRTWWAQSLYVLAAMATVGLLIYLRQRQLVAIQRRLERRLREQEQRLTETSNQLNESRQALSAAQNEYEDILAEGERQRAARAHFEADLSHAIRPAVTSVTHLGRLLAREELSERARSLVGGVREAGEKLLGAVREFLDLRRLEIAHLPIENAPFDLRDPIEQTLASLASAAHAKGLELNYTIESGLAARRRGDPLRLKQVLCHLLSNAVSQTPEGEVTVSVRRMQGKSTDYVEFVVVDNGPGLDRDAQNRILEQSDPQNLPRYRGAPQGLAIARQLLHALDGDLSIESTQEEGARMHFHLNLPPASAREADWSPFQDRLVLIVDDNPTTLKCLQQLAEEYGLQTRLANNAPQAREALKEKPPANLLWIDEDLGDSAGSDLLAQIRQSRAGADLPVILLAPQAHNPRLQQLDGDPATLVLGKPFHHGPLLAASRGLLAGPEDPGAPSEADADEVAAITEATGDDDKGETSAPAGAADTEAEGGDPLDAKIRAALARSGEDTSGSKKNEPTPSPLRILILDAHPVRPLATLDLLHRLGYQASLAKDLGAALSAFENAPHPYELVLLSPPFGKQGLAATVTELCRNLPPGADPVLAALAHTVDDDARTAGLQEHLRLPLDPEALLRLLELTRPLPGTEENKSDA